MIQTFALQFSIGEKPELTYMIQTFELQFSIGEKPEVINGVCG